MLSATGSAPHRLTRLLPESLPYTLSDITLAILLTQRRTQSGNMLKRVKPHWIIQPAWY